MLISFDLMFCVSINYDYEKEESLTLGPLIPGLFFLYC